MRPVKKPVLVLNADRWTHLHTIPFNDAVVGVIKGTYKIKAAVRGQHLHGGMRADGTRYEMPWPVSVYVNKYVHIEYKDIAPSDTILATRMAILHRDLFTCQYCGDDAATWDHVQPKSKGGENTWLNLVAACSVCNGFKADMTLAEAQRKLEAKLADPLLAEEERARLPPTMKLQRQPFVPDHDPYRRTQKDIWELLESGELEDLEEL